MKYTWQWFMKYLEISQTLSKVKTIFMIIPKYYLSFDSYSHLAYISLKANRIYDHVFLYVFLFFLKQFLVFISDVSIDITQTKGLCVPQ